MFFVFYTLNDCGDITCGLQGLATIDEVEKFINQKYQQNQDQRNVEVVVIEGRELKVEIVERVTSVVVRR